MCHALQVRILWFCINRSINGLQNYVGFLETFGLLGNTSAVNSSDTSECNQPSELPAESLLILVSEKPINEWQGLCGKMI